MQYNVSEHVSIKIIKEKKKKNDRYENYSKFKFTISEVAVPATDYYQLWKFLNENIERLQ